MSEPPNVRDRVVAEILAVSDADITTGKVTDVTTLRGDLGLKSLQAVTLVLNLEELYGIVVEEDELATMGTVGDVVGLVEARLARRGAPPA